MKQFFVFLFLIVFTISANAQVATLVADTKSGFVLSAQNASLEKYPASLTKVMTLYLTFSALEKGIIKMNTPLSISKKASQQPRSKLYVKAGETMTVKEAIMALIIKSANDVAVVLAENLASSEEEFAKMMCDVSKELGLKSTIFKNASGLYHKDQVTTVQDMAILAIAMINHFPQYYPLFSQKSFVYKQKRYYSHNYVTNIYKGAEGLKTGFISAVGYNILTTAKRDDTRLVAVVIGEDSVSLRDKKAMKILDDGFSVIKKHQNVTSKQVVLNKPNMQACFQKMQQCVSQRTLKSKSVLSKISSNHKNTTWEMPQKMKDFWMIQVGAYAQKELADKQAQKAYQKIDNSNKEMCTMPNKDIYRSRILGFKTKDEAQQACSMLKNHQMSCFILEPFS